MPWSDDRFGQALQIVRGVTEQAFDHHRASEVVTDGVFFRHADAAVHLYRALRHVATGLADADRQILLLTLVDNLKPAAIAARMGVSAEAARTRKTRALRRVKDVLAGLSRPAARDHSDG